MILFRNIDRWIDRCDDVLERASLPGYRLGAPPADLPGIDVLMAGQPGSGKSTLGNLMLGYRDEPLFEGRDRAAELPRFQEDLVSLARRFPDRYTGAHTIPVSAVQAATLPSLPAALGVRFTELWGMSLAGGASRAAMMQRLLDASPERSVLLLVVRADQQLDEPERELLAQIVPSPWRDSVMVVLNLRSTGHEAEQIIKLKGFVEEQCIGSGLAPRGVFALDARSGSSPIEGEVERFGDALTDVLIRLWSPAHAGAVSGMLARPLDVAEDGAFEGLGLADETAGALRAEIGRGRKQVDEALGRHGRRRSAALRAVERLSAKAVLEMEEELDSLPNPEIATRPREALRRLRVSAIREIEEAMGKCEDTSSWPVPDLVIRQRPGPGCMPIGAAVLSGVIAIGVTIAALWPLTAAFAVVAVGFVALSAGLTVTARRKWRSQSIEAFKAVLAEQTEAARAAVEEVHARMSDPARLVPEIRERLERLEAASRTVGEIATLSEDLGGLVAPGPAPDTKPAAEARRPGHLTRRLAAALAPGRPLNAFFHENGFDTGAVDLFARACEIEYALAPLGHLQSVETVRQWLRPPLPRRERTVYPFLDRLRMRWDEAAGRTQAIIERIVRKADPAGIEVSAEAAQAPGTPPRIAVAEEALEAVIERILDEAVKHAFAGEGTPAIAAAWSLGSEQAAVLALEIRGGRGFDAAGRQSFDSGRGGLARFLSDAVTGALGWCSEVVIETRDGEEVWARSVHEPGGRFERRDASPAAWSTRFVLAFPALIEEG